MSAFPASVRSIESLGRGACLWVRGLNWLGDSVMALPALASVKRLRPDLRLLVGCRANLSAFWACCPCVDGVQSLPPGLGGDRAAAAALRQTGAARAVVLPNSFRSAWVPFLARVPERVGFPGSWRRFLLTHPVHPVSYSGSRHQALDYFALFGTAPGAVPPVLDGLLRVPEEALGRMAGRLGGGAPWLTVAPGAARGGAKRWPAESFAEAAAEAVRRTGCRVAVCGTAAERPAAAVIAAAVPGGVLDLTGATGLAELAALFRLSRAVLCNDSGPMHLAAAAGARVAAVFGLTDPGRTGPLGEGHAVLSPAGAAGRVDIPRESAKAEAALKAVRPGEVAEAVAALLNRP